MALRSPVRPPRCRQTPLRSRGRRGQLPQASAPQCRRQSRLLWTSQQATEEAAADTAAAGKPDGLLAKLQARLYDVHVARVRSRSPAALASLSAPTSPRKAGKDTDASAAKNGGSMRQPGRQNRRQMASGHALPQWGGWRRNCDQADSWRPRRRRHQWIMTTKTPLCSSRRRCHGRAASCACTAAASAFGAARCRCRAPCRWTRPLPCCRLPSW